MLCTKCRREIPDDAVLCCYCGKKYIKEKRTGSRANGTGSVYYDASKRRWVAQIVSGRHYTPDMKLRFEFKRKYFSSRTEALQHVQTMKEEKEARPDFTVSYYYAAFERGKGASLSHDKQVAYRIAYNRLKSLHGVAVKDLTISDLQKVLNASCSSYYPARDVRSLLNAIFRLAAADDREINPVLPGLLQLPKMEEAQVEPFTEEEQLRLWYSYESGQWNAALPLIMIYTGMMTGEIRQLRKDMIRLEDKEIVNAGLKTAERKKKAILLPDDILPVLEDMINRSPTDHLFPMKDDNFYRLYYSALADAGITRHLTPYSCRHTTATVLAVHSNVAPQTLQRVMRWKSTRMMDRYVTPTDTDARKAVNKI